MGAALAAVGAGRPSLPAAVKRLKGTLRPSRESASAPSATPSRVTAPPPKLSKAEKEVWFELAPLVNGMGVISKADLPAFRALACSVAAVRAAYAARDYKLVCVLDPRAEKWLSHFGMTPATRAKVSVVQAPGSKGSPTDEFRSP